MITVCKVDKCPYKSKNGFCRNRVLSITENGLCGHIYNNNGAVKPRWQETIEEMYMDGYKPKEKIEFIVEKQQQEK